MFGQDKKISRGQYIQMVDDAKSVVHAPRTAPVHKMPLYKVELEKMIRDDIMTPLTGSTDWVNSREGTTMFGS